MSALSKVQREVLQLAATEGIDRWSFEGTRLRSIKILIDLGFLETTETYEYRITDAGREALK